MNSPPSTQGSTSPKSDGSLAADGGIHRHSMVIVASVPAVKSSPSPPLQPSPATANTAPPEEKKSSTLQPVNANTTPEQMAALLGPSWKSRQPRMCQYCNRMFSNKFNLKQVSALFSIT